MITRADTKHPQYFEGILQLRNPTDELIDWVKNQIATDGKAFISKEEQVQNGVDYYMSSQTYLRALGKKIIQKFQGVMKSSRSLHTVSRDTGRRLYRVNVLFKLTGLARGAIINFRGEKFEVMLLNKNQAQLKNMASGEKFWKKIEDLI